MKICLPSRFSSWLAAICLAAMPVSAHAAVLTGSTTDVQVNSVGTFGDPNDYQSRIGEFFYPGGSSYVAPFLLPTLGAGEQFTAASLRYQLFGLPVASNGGIGVDLYGLGQRASDTVLTSDYYSGIGDVSDATLLKANLFNESTALGVYNTDAGTNAALVAYLNAQYANGAGAGQYVFLRFSYAADVPNSNTGFAVLTQNAGGTTERPEFTYTAAVVPEPGTAALLLGGLAATLGARRRRASV